MTGTRGQAAQGRKSMPSAAPSNMPSNPGTPSDNSGKIWCTDCNANLSVKTRCSITCDFCESWYCLKCSKLKNSIFNEIGDDPAILWTCQHCRISLPGIKKTMTRLTVIEAKYDILDKKIDEIKTSQSTAQDRGDLRQVVREELNEERELESRRLNILAHFIFERETEEANSDQTAVSEILNDTLGLNVQTHDFIRLGHRFNGRRKPRPIRFRVGDMNMKRKILEASPRLRHNPDHANVFFTPDLTKRQREEGYQLRQEKRRREEAGEDRLIIRRGKIVPKPTTDNSQSSARAANHSQSSTPHQQGMPGPSNQLSRGPIPQESRDLTAASPGPVHAASRPAHQSSVQTPRGQVSATQRGQSQSGQYQRTPGQPPRQQMGQTQGALPNQSGSANVGSPRTSSPQGDGGGFRA